MKLIGYSKFNSFFLAKQHNDNQDYSSSPDTDLSYFDEQYLQKLF